MEKRKNSLGAVKMCRFCLVQNESLGSLYDRNHSSKSSVNLHLKILSCVSIEVYPSDHMPTFICERCKFFMNLFYEYKQIVRQADETILQYIRHGTSMEIISWPTELTNIFQNKVVNTVVEGGATVQVTSHDNSDSDDDEGNIYNIKIGNTPDEGNTACVKVVTSKDENEINEDSHSRGKESEVDQDQPRGSEKGLEDGCWPCDECNCTYPLQQLLNLHKRQKHRVRTVPCDQCDAKFFSKYDLAAHQLRHTDEMPFQCIACGKKFKRLILLKRHEKHIHSDLPQQVCPSCPATFLSIEELDEHQKRHIRLQRPYDCALCGKKFYEKTSLQRHKDAVHNKTPTYCCEYCPERFVSVTKLARHVRSHAGERPYPCKFCNKCFTKSHHYTRHLRLKHREMNRSGRGPFGETELYRCEQCEDTFSTQDDLIYHSAIHATQNLTCPLCQEKFEDIDAVTSHIKSHVNSEEFSCDFCELVFTSKEKLEIHTLKTHEDEMQDLSADDSSVEIQGEVDDDCDNEINVKDKGDHMLIEIKKAGDFMIDNTKDDIEDKPDITNSEESETETTYTEISNVSTLAILKKESTIVEEKPASKPVDITTHGQPVKAPTSGKSDDGMTATILRKAEEMKRKVVQQTLDTVVEKKLKPVTKVETTNTGGASDKSLRLLEKELQDLKRTNSRTEITKNPTKSSEIIRNKRPQVHTSTPKLKVTEEKKLPLINKPPALEKKLIEKRVITKENKEPKETKEPKNNNGSNKEDKDNKEKETPKSLYKNGSSNDKINIEEGIRRSTRPSKIKNYAKMIRARSQVEDNDDTSEDDEDYIEVDRNLEARLKSRRSSQTPKPTPKPVFAPGTPVTAPRKRGRPKKENPKEIPAKIRKDEIEEVDNSKTINSIKQESSTANKDEMETDASSNEADNNKSVCKTPPEPKPASSDVLVSPTGQTLKKVPIKALPPGVKPLPLPIIARPMATGELCEMQIGKKLVKVQKIVMTKAEVEAMAKKGLVEMKDGTMVLKQGIKLPTVETSAIKPTVNSVGDEETEKETIKSEKATPTRCDLGDES
ncbi:uncharacterized protein LOC126778494 isoform X5 [Nymphalis io]|uniref:uncharacterized protein LOC126778494 isoform X5 n=1 Tax=Inachis io TaxID=171585 RepID=UPI002167C0A5|nr:uncharacterized protein LOC126778494 isoform X5 [Nymphalis io]